MGRVGIRKWHNELLHRLDLVERYSEDYSDQCPSFDKGRVQWAHPLSRGFSLHYTATPIRQSPLESSRNKPHKFDTVSLIQCSKVCSPRSKYSMSAF